MFIKRFACLLLAAVLALCVVSPALADNTQALTEVTEKVIQELDIDDSYTDFSGDRYDSTVPYWGLSWSDDTRSAWVECRDDGLILSANFSTAGSYVSDSFYGYDPTLPALSEEEAHDTCEYWCERLLDADETPQIGSGRYNSYLDSWSFTVNVLKNDLPSPVTVSVEIGVDGLKSYSRSDEYLPFTGGTPSAVPAVEQAEAADLLQSGLAVECRYVTPEDGGEAQLVWVPVSAQQYVDAQTGDVSDRETEALLYANSMMAAQAGSAQSDGAVRDLTEAELEGISAYDAALPQDELDSILRALPELSLDGYTLDSCSYRNGEDGELTAELSYSAIVDENHLYGYSLTDYENAYWGDSMTVSCTVTMDAYTGEILSLNRWWPIYAQEEETVSDTQPAQAFVDACAPEYAERVELQSVSGDLCSFVRTENGYPYPDNYLTVELNPVTGTIDSYSRVWTDDITFAAPDGLISEDEAVQALADAMTVTLGYVGVYDETGDAWSSETRSLLLAWYYDGMDAVRGVGAKTGEVLYTSSDEAESYTYDDLSDCPQKAEIETLAGLNIGFSGGSFAPDSALTVLDAVTLLLQSDENYYTDDAETLMTSAISRGFITADRQADDAVTQGEFLRMMLAPSRYGDAAALTGIWAEPYTDGYAAIAAALGVTNGTEDGSEPCTRAEAAEMLYAFMRANSEKTGA